MFNQVDAGILTPRELELVSRVVHRLCSERGHDPDSIDGQDLAARAFAIFQMNRDVDEAALEAALCSKP